MAQYAVDLVYKTKGLGALDQATAKLKGMGQGAKSAQNSLVSTGKAALGSVLGIKGMGAASATATPAVAGLGTAAGAALAPILPLIAGVAGLSAAFGVLKDQDFALKKFETLGGNSQELVQELKAVSAELNNNVGVAELTGAAYDVASAGFGSASDAAAVLKASAEGAIGGFTDINTVANATTSVLNAYGMSANEASSVVDKFIQTQNDGKVVMEELANNIGKVASAAAGLKIPLDEVNAVIAQATAAGVPAEVAFTGLKTALAGLASGDATTRMKELGIDINAATIESDGLAGTLRKIKDSGADVGQVFKLLGSESAPALLPILNNLEKFDELLRNQGESAGVAAEAQKLASDTIAGAWDRVVNSVQNLFAEQSALGTAFKVTLDVIAIAVDALAVSFNVLMAPLKLMFSFLQDVGTVATAAFQALLPHIQALGEAIDKTFNVSGAMAVFKDFLDSIAQNPVFKVMAAALKNVAERLGFAAKEGKKLDKEVKAAGKSAGELAAEAKNAAEALQEARDVDLTAALKEADDALKSSLSTLDDSLKISQARSDAEKQITGALLEQAEARLKSASSAEEQVAAATAVFKLTVKQAEQEYLATKASIDSMVKKAKLQADFMNQKYWEIQAAVKLAEAYGTVTDAHYEALAAQSEASSIALENYKTAQKIGQEQERGAKAVLQGAKAAAQAAFEVNKVYKETQKASRAAGGFAQNMKAGASAAKEAAVATERAAAAAEKAGQRTARKAPNPASGGAKTGTMSFSAEAWASAQGSRPVSGSQQSGGAWAMYIKKMVEFDKNAKEREQAAQQRARENATWGAPEVNINAGEIKPQVNIQTGPVTQMDGTNYATMDDMQRVASDSARQGAAQALSQLQNDPGARRQAGLGR